jgi:hypothetical protein
MNGKKIAFYNRWFLLKQLKKATLQIKPSTRMSISVLLLPALHLPFA